jgi:hypothetical protein
MNKRRINFGLEPPMKTEQQQLVAQLAGFLPEIVRQIDRDVRPQLVRTHLFR